MRTLERNVEFRQEQHIIAQAAIARASRKIDEAKVKKVTAVAFYTKAVGCTERELAAAESNVVDIQIKLAARRAAVLDFSERHDIFVENAIQAHKDAKVCGDAALDALLAAEGSLASHNRAETAARLAEMGCEKAPGQRKTVDASDTTNESFSDISERLAKEARQNRKASDNNNE